MNEVIEAIMEKLTGLMEVKAEVGVQERALIQGIKDFYAMDLEGEIKIKIGSEDVALLLYGLPIEWMKLEHIIKDFEPLLPFWVSVEDDALKLIFVRGDEE